MVSTIVLAGMGKSTSPQLLSNRPTRTPSEITRLALQRLPDSALVLFDLDLGFLSAQGSLLDRLKVFSRAVVGKPALEAFTPLSQGLLELRCRSALRDSESSLEMQIGEYSYQVHIMAVKDEGSRIVAGMMLWQDISAFKTERQRSHSALDPDQEKITALRSFIRDISHDFRTSLAIVNSSAYLMEQLADQGRRSDHRQKIVVQVDRLVKILEKMLTLTRLESGDHLSYVPISVNQFIKDTISKLEKSAERKNLQIALHLEAEFPIVFADENILNMALYNIMENAVQYTPEGGMISVRVRRLDHGVLIEIADSGPGIAQDDLDRIFEMLYRGDKSRSTTTGGSGLGLTIAKRAIEAHRGKIEVESTPNKGTTFRVLLPLNKLVNL
ncbi:MAG: hypothetical protein KF726_25055 [Anaerolineae bacterium]|nr:hypothetical protein [Anaerolineae bacterium]